MDLHFTADEPTATEREAIDAVLGRSPSWWTGGERSALDGHYFLGGLARSQRHQLLPVLHALNDRIGWLSAGALNYTCLRLDVPPAEAYGVASFYGLFSTTPRPPAVAHVCDDIACRLAGADELCARLRQRFGAAGEPAAGATVTWHRSPCLGQCDRAPAALVLRAGTAGARQHVVAPASEDALEAALTSARAVDVAPPAVHAGLGSKLLRRIGVVDPQSIDAYRASGGYAALRRALELGPDKVRQEVAAAKLLGRGGAAFPTARKWDAVAREPARPHYLVCNADESEPGTFKDRVLMEGDPFAVVEAMTIAGFAGECERGFVYIRGEYPLAARRLENAIDAARNAGMLGPAVAGSRFSFDVEIRRGAGAYICGEETALFNSIEGLRGEPRNKPPFPVQRGLFGKPTIVNNVETLVNVESIMLEGGAAFAATGTAESTGTRLFCLSGHVQQPGVYEVPFGTKLAELIARAGGVHGGEKLQAVLLGGAAGTFLTPDEIDVPLSFEGVRAVGATLGSGVVMLFDRTADLAATLLRIAAFFRDESCGQCVPCRVGTVRQEELLRRLFARAPLGSASQERALLADIGQVMRDASICGLGQTASSAIESALKKLDVINHA